METMRIGEVQAKQKDCGSVFNCVNLLLKIC